MLLVKPYRDHWTIPGGVVGHNEPPDRAWEAREELSLALPSERPLVMSWLAAHDPIPHPMIGFIFDGGHINDPASIHIDADELEDFAFFPLPEATRRLHHAAAYTLPIAAQARATGVPRYLSYMAAPGPVLKAADTASFGQGCSGYGPIS